MDMEENGDMQFDQGMQEEEYSNDGGNEAIKGLTITCEDCGLELDAHFIAEHICSASETPDFEETEIKMVTAMEKDSPSPTKPNIRTTSKDSDEAATSETGFGSEEDGDKNDDGETDEFEDSNEGLEKMKEPDEEPFTGKEDGQSTEDAESNSQKLVTSAPTDHGKGKGGDHQEQLSLIEKFNDAGESSHATSAININNVDS